MKKVLLLLLLIAGGMSTASATEYTIYFINGGAWSKVNAHLFNAENEGTQKTAWPGLEMSKTSQTFNGVECVYSLTFDTSTLGFTPDKVIFSNNGSSQLASQDLENGETYTYYSTFDLYLPNSLNSWNGSDNNYKSKGVWDGTQDVYEFNLSSATIGENDFYFRLKFSDWTDQIRPYNDTNDFTYTFTEDGQWETHKSGHDGYFGSTGSFKLAQSTEKASEYRIRVYAKRGSEYYVKAEIISKPVTISAGKATFSCNRALDFTDTGISAYMITDASAGVLTPSAAMGKVPANTGLYIEGSNKTYNVPVVKTSDASAVSTTGNMLVAGSGAVVATTESEGTITNYILTNKTINGDAPLKFYKANGNTVPAGKAYLQIPTEYAAREFFWFDGETTAVKAVKQEQKFDGKVFNLAGQRIANPTKGLYIVNGKKVIK